MAGLQPQCANQDNGREHSQSCREGSSHSGTSLEQGDKLQTAPPRWKTGVPAMLVKRRCNSQTQPQGSAVITQLLQGFRRGFQAWENPSFWMTLENSGMLANLPFLSVYDSISGNTHSFGFSTMVLGGEGQDEVKRKSNASKGRPPCLSKSIFTSTDRSSPGPGEVPETQLFCEVLCGHQYSSDENVGVAALNSSYSIYVKQEKSGLPICERPVITTL